jgi:Response regulator receiver domain
MLPKKTGFNACRELRQWGDDTAILMLTAKTQVIDRVVGLKLGADDYLAKPFDPAELLARVEALLRRIRKEGGITLWTFAFDDVEVDFERAEVRKSKQMDPMTAKELQLLRYLVNHRDVQVVWHLLRGDVSAFEFGVYVIVHWVSSRMSGEVSKLKVIITGGSLVSRIARRALSMSLQVSASIPRPPALETAPAKVGQLGCRSVPEESAH